MVVDYYREYTDIILKNVINSNINMNISLFYEKQDSYKVIKDLTYYIGNAGVDLKDNNDNRKYYKTYEDATNGVNVLFEQNNTIDPFDDVHSKFIDYKDSLQKATFTFEEKNGVLTLVDYILA